jgi:hypothetical protein
VLSSTCLRNWYFSSTIIPRGRTRTSDSEKGAPKLIDTPKPLIYRPQSITASSTAKIHLNHQAVDELAQRCPFVGAAIEQGL